MDYVTSGGLKEWYKRLGDIHHGTVNIIAVDARGSIASAVSTSGTALKLPGRLGDSPIIGAGNYCDNRFGAAACTGRGELAIRLSTARTIVSYMENGKGLREACKRAMKDVNDLEANGVMNCLATDIEGNTMSATTSQGRESIHYYMNADTDIPEKRIGITVKP
jgi:beta-aspartyl-peptidase (threonine type)